MLVSPHGIWLRMALGRDPARGDRHRAIASCGRWLVACIVFLACADLAPCQDGKVREEASRDVFWVAAWKQPIAESIWFSGKGAEGVLETVPWMQRSGPYKRPQGEIRFFADPPPASGQVETPRRLIGAVTIPDEVKRPLLIFIPEKRGAQAGYRIEVVDDDPREFPFGSYRFQNLTRYEIEGTIDTMPFKVLPNEVITIRPSFGRVMDIVVKAAMRKSQGAVPIVETMWTYEPNLRKYLIFGESPEGRGVELQSLVEYERRN